LPAQSGKHEVRPSHFSLDIHSAQKCPLLHLGLVIKCGLMGPTYAA
jgi:hypothetical protein